VLLLNKHILIFFYLLSFSLGALAQDSGANEKLKTEDEFFSDEEFEEFDDKGSPNVPEEQKTTSPINESFPEPLLPEEEAQQQFEASEDLPPIDGEAIPEEDEPRQSLIEELDREPIPFIKRDRKELERTYYQKKQYIRHPFAKKGLIRIDKNKTYFYRVSRSKQNRASSIRFGFFDPSNLQNPDGKSFDVIYDQSSGPMILYDYEWQMWRTFLGKTGFKLGSGLYRATGNGTFENTTTLTPREEFTFFVFPNSASIVQRFQWWDTQTFVPFVEAGVGYYAFAERRDDDQNPALGAKIGGAATVHGAGGIAISMNAFDANSLLELDNEYGINSVWLIAEFRLVVGLHPDFDFSSNVINAGFMVEF